MIDISKGRYWDLPWSLVDGCTPCSPGCDHCWSAGMWHRFHGVIPEQRDDKMALTDLSGRFRGKILTHPERLSIPLKRRKPTVYAVWNDWAHEKVGNRFRSNMMTQMKRADRHTYLACTKRPHVMLDFYRWYGLDPPKTLWNGLTVCNQQEADEKIPIFLQVPGKKFLSLEPLLGPVDLGLSLYSFHIPDHFDRDLRKTPAHESPGIDAVIIGGETGPGARPMHPDWVRSVRDQCAAAAVPFFLKSLGEWSLRGNMKTGCEYIHSKDGRLLDGRTHDDLLWVKP